MGDALPLRSEPSVRANQKATAVRLRPNILCRRFRLDLRVMEFSTLYQELQNSTEMIRALLAGVAPEAARLKPSAESWSILEVVCHLYDKGEQHYVRV